eukprot:CAMPEP_0178553268 /NCGR_PEP_ID=MMETSP0697-20121206/7729_1 /TAXON_ID=265572 /ORGANISM="Extubocellulus spinifer, Strain CCMP396" /LENGTH=591 /DNA_ID=CAMNT_0020186179 /DNA_START=115 /DNA_END=1890 /DNA_ORIENTATION=-
MPNKKKQRAAERRAAKQGQKTGAAAAAAGGGGRNSSSSSRRPDPTAGARSLGTEPNYYRKAALIRPAPDVNVDPLTLKRGVLGVEPDKRTTTCRRFVEAYNLLDGVALRLGKAGAGGGCDARTVPVDVLTADSAHMTICADMLRAINLTDWRVAFTTDILQPLRIPTCFSSITRAAFPAGSSSEICLANVGAKDFVCLLVAAVVGSFGRLASSSLRIVHELRVHAEEGYSWLDWNDLTNVKGSDGRPLTENEVRFALATVAIKVTRRMYRSGASGSPMESSPFFDQPHEKDLLASIEVFSKDQRTFRPQCGTGYFNLGWVASQAPAIRGTNGLTAAADSLEYMTKAYETAELEDDDLLKSAARIEAAACLILGGGGIIGLLDGNMVERDFRSREAKIADGTIQIVPSADGDGTQEIRKLDRLVIRAESAAQRSSIQEHEQRRMANGFPDTFMSPGETLLVEPWEVRRLWNHSMVQLDSLAKWNHSHYVYGETAGWEGVVSFLREFKRMAYNQYAPAPDEPGFPPLSDRGLLTPSLHYDKGKDGVRKVCNWCGKNGIDLKWCPLCKTVCYCDKSCQTMHWKKGGHKAECAGR